MSALEDFAKLLPDDPKAQEHRAALLRARDWATWRMAGLPDGVARTHFWDIADAVTANVARRCSAEHLRLVRAYCQHLAQAARVAQQIEAEGNDGPN